MSLWLMFEVLTLPSSPPLKIRGAGGVMMVVL